MKRLIAILSALMLIGFVPIATPASASAAPVVARKVITDNCSPTPPTPGWVCFYTEYTSSTHTPSVHSSDSYPGSILRNKCVSIVGFPAFDNETNSVLQFYRGSDHGCQGATVGITPTEWGPLNAAHPGWTGVGSFYRRAAN